MAPIKPRFQTSALSAIHEFRAALLSWFSRHGKDYPWRRNSDPYAILISEVMLQQTRIATVLGKNYFTRFLEIFPNLEALAKADDTSLLKAWEGLGYYRRARMLRATAAAVIQNHGGKFPYTASQLLALPGIGHYTSAALLSFAFNQPSALVDGNVSRVFSRLMDDPEPIDSTSVIRRQRDWAYALCDPHQPAAYQHAIMELGQTICTSHKPDCIHCPVSRFCKCTEPESLPNRKPRVTITHITEHAIWARNHQGHLLLHHENGTRHNGLWKLPIRPQKTCASLHKIHVSSYSITRYKVTLLIHLLPSSNPINLEKGEHWIEKAQLSSLPIAAPFKKAIAILSKDD